MGGRSRAAAQLLSGEGFQKVYNLKGGMAAWQGLKAFGPIEMGMESLTGDENVTDIISLAYGMENGLQEFYHQAKGLVEGKETVTLLVKLGDIEEQHKERLFHLYLSLNPISLKKQDFEINLVSRMMEGGFTTEEFLEKNRDVLKGTSDVLGIAMMLEAQALDLYLRYSRKTKDEKSRDVLYGIAEEEKAHLSSLGQMMERITKKE